MRGGWTRRRPNPRGCEGLRLIALCAGQCADVTALQIDSPPHKRAMDAPPPIKKQRLAVGKKPAAVVAATSNRRSAGRRRAR